MIGEYLIEVTVDWSRGGSLVSAETYHYSASAGGNSRMPHQTANRMASSNWTSWTLDKTRTEPHLAFFFVELVRYTLLDFPIIPLIRIIIFSFKKGLQRLVYSRVYHSTGDVPQQVRLCSLPG